MIDQNFLLRFSLAVIAISLFFGVLNYFDIQYQFYVWEIFIDLRIVAIITLIFLFYKQHHILFSHDQLSVLKFAWQKNILFFFLPLLVYSITIIFGILLNQITMNKLDNAVTLVLASLFDIPAIYFFSVTSVLIEEIIFRGILITSLRQSFSKVLSVLISCSLWTVFAASEIPGVDNLNIGFILMLLVYFASLGLLLSVIVERYNSIWPGYSVRMGIITLTPITLSSHIIESDSFFKSSSTLFNSEGIVIAVLLVGLSLVLMRKNDQKITIPEIVEN